MSISANSLTLAQYANQANDPLIAKVVNSLYQLGSVVQDWSLVTNPTLKVNGTRMVGNMPSVTWRNINESAATTSGTLTPYQEQAFLLSNNIDVDKALILDKNAVSDPRGIQLMHWFESWVYDTNDKFFNNNHVTGNAKAPVGIRARLDSPSVWGTNSECKVDAGGVDMTASLTAGTAAAFCGVVDRVLMRIGAFDGSNCVIYMNRLLFERWSMGIKLMGAGGGFDMTKDAFDRLVLRYRNAVIRVVGVKADQSTEIITNTESTAGADSSDDRTSFYVVRYGEGYFQPWQMAPLAVTPIGIRSDEPTIFRTNVEWSCGFEQPHTRAVGRAFNIEVA